jgi:DNA invertase Pin-like site-specific DNA recombinase
MSISGVFDAETRRRGVRREVSDRAHFHASVVSFSCDGGHLDDTATPTGRAMWQMIGVLAELERSLISERTRAGVKAAQHRGVKFDRKVKLTRAWIEPARKLIDRGEGRQHVANLMSVGRSTLYRALVS